MSMVDDMKRKEEINDADELGGFEIDNTVPMVYTNSAIVNMSTNDLIVSFFVRIADNYQEQIKIMMSPQYAKSLIGLLNTALADYEDTFGELNIAQKTMTDVIDK